MSYCNKASIFRTGFHATILTEASSFKQKKLSRDHYIKNQNFAPVKAKIRSLITKFRQAEGFGRLTQIPQWGMWGNCSFNIHTLDNTNEDKNWNYL